MSDLSTSRFYVTPPHPCSYLDRDDAATIFVDPKLPLDTSIYTELSQKGFRRSGHYLYRPHCSACNACIPTRVPVNHFIPRKKHRRILKKNTDLSVSLLPPRFEESHYQLYERYISLKHRNGDMFPPSQEQYRSFLLCDWSPTQLMAFHLDQQLVAVSVVDQLHGSLSAVYTFYDPLHHCRSLGIYAILTQIDLCQKQGLDYLYLGYWVKACQKMRYKSEFYPIEFLVDQQWKLVDNPGHYNDLPS